MKLNFMSALCEQSPGCQMVTLTLRSVLSWFTTIGVLNNAASVVPPPNFVPAVHSFKPTGNSAFRLPSNLRVVVDSAHASSTQDDGLTLIPPSLHDFAQTFVSDLKELFPTTSVSLSLGSESSLNKLSDYVFLSIKDNSNHTLANGSPTAEGYELEVTSRGAKISAAGARGAFWGTRTLLQGFVLADGQFPASVINDQPDWKTRGLMLGEYTS